MDTMELSRLTNQLERGLSRATKATRALERLIADKDEDWILIEGLEQERTILEKVSADINELDKAISRIYPVEKTSQEKTLDKQKVILEIQGGLKALEDVENGIKQGNIDIVLNELLTTMQAFLRLRKMFAEEKDS